MPPSPSQKQDSFTAALEASTKEMAEMTKFVPPLSLSQRLVIESGAKVVKDAVAERLKNDKSLTLGPLSSTAALVVSTTFY
jgi:hypothetical protein